MVRRVCPWWHGYAIDNVFRRLINDPRKIVGPYISEGMTVTDIGCGMGLFSIPVAKMVGEDGLVIAIDVQQKMLDVVVRRARRAGVANRIRTYCCEADNIGLNEKVDFALAFWVMHEVPDEEKFLRQLCTSLRNEGKILLAEPVLHVSRRRFEEVVALAQTLGLRLSAEPRIIFSRAALFESGGAG